MVMPFPWPLPKFLARNLIFSQEPYPSQLNITLPVISNSLNPNKCISSGPWNLQKCYAIASLKVKWLSPSYLWHWILAPFRNYDAISMAAARTFPQGGQKSQQEKLTDHIWTSHCLCCPTAKRLTSAFRVDFEIYKKPWNTCDAIASSNVGDSGFWRQFEMWCHLEIFLRYLVNLNKNFTITAEHLILLISNS